MAITYQNSAEGKPYTTVAKLPCKISSRKLKICMIIFHVTRWELPKFSSSVRITDKLSYMNQMTGKR